MSETQTLEKWQISTRLLANPDIQIIVLEFLGKGSAKNYNVVVDELTETYKAGGRWKYIAVQPHHAPFLMKPRGEGKPALFKLAPSLISQKILEYNNGRAKKKAETTNTNSDVKKMMVLDGMFSEMKNVSNASNKTNSGRGKNKDKEVEPVLEKQEEPELVVKE